MGENVFRPPETQAGRQEAMCNAQPYLESLSREPTETGPLDLKIEMIQEQHFQFSEVRPAYPGSSDMANTYAVLGNLGYP
jgi:hypothetical protein